MPILSDGLKGEMYINFLSQPIINRETRQYILD